jgi:pimeloyl-ACP methyl ester carboxylesterase
MRPPERIRLPGRTDELQARAWNLGWAPQGNASATFVLVHGVGLSHRPYARLARALAGRGTVIAVDMPGFGGLAHPKTPLSVPELAQVVAEVLARMGVTRFVVIGHSMGAQIALELALLFPQSVAGLVLIGPVVNPLRPSLLLQSLDLARDSSKEPFDTNATVFRDYLACGMRWYLTEARQMMLYRTDERIHLLSTPLLVVRGADDCIAPAEWCEWLARQVPGGRVASIPGRRHVIVHSAPKATAAHIGAFAQALAPQ